MGKKTVVVGASPNPDRYSHTAVKKLLQYGHEAIALGLRKGKIGEVDILTEWPEIGGTDTVSLYVGADHQPALYEYLLGLKPKRLIFNPGTENSALEKLALKQGIEVVKGCSLVMLAVGTF